MKAMESIQDLIEEAKVQTVWWGLCIFSVTYFLTNTSKSMWMNVPMAIFILGAMRILLKAVSTPRQLYYFEKKQLSVNDAHLSGSPPRWKKKINSRIVEAAMNAFIDNILNDFVVNSWYSTITPDKEAPELIRSVLMDTLGEISVRVKEIDIIGLLTRDMVDLIGDHLDMFRRNQDAIGIDVMKKLTSEQRDERLKSQLKASGELYPALVSPESEYKVLQKMVDGIFSEVLPKEAQWPLVRTMVREFFTCLVMQPVLHLACPERINKFIARAVHAQQHEKNRDGQQCLKLKCRVRGAYFEELESESFAVYSIEVTDMENKTWFVMRRYSNFESLHSQLMNEIPNYNLQLPPDLTFSSSTDDDFAYRRCFPLDKYLQDLLCIANVAEHDEVRDFLSEGSKNYSFGKPSLMVKSFAVTADDAVDNIARRVKGFFRLQLVSPDDRLSQIYKLIEKVFQLDKVTELGRMTAVLLSKVVFKGFSFTMEDIILNMVSLNWLRNEDRVAQGIHLAQDILWPNGVFFNKVSDSQEASDETELRNSSVQQCEASGDADEVKKLLFDGAPPFLVKIVGNEHYKECVRDIYYFTQSNLCIKQLTFAILELLLRSVFPEPQDLLRDIRESHTVGESTTEE